MLVGRQDLLDHQEQVGTDAILDAPAVLRGIGQPVDVVAAPVVDLVFLDGDCVPALRFVQMHSRLAEAGHFVNGSRVLLSQALTGRVVSREVDLAGLRLPQWLRLRAHGDVNKLTHLFPWPGAPGRVE